MNEQEAWERQVPLSLKTDRLWKSPAYREALRLADEGWADVQVLLQARCWVFADQLLRSLGSVSANFSEGYSRRSPAEKAQRYEYSLSSGREAREWYFKARHILGNDWMQERVERCTRVIRLLSGAVAIEREKASKREKRT